MKRCFLGLMTAALLLAASGVYAQNYAPDTYVFDGTNALAFEPAQQLDLSAGGTIEFWVSPDWTGDPGYDPVILSNAGPRGPSYLIAMLRDRDGLAFASGDDEEDVAFDFTDGKMHFVAVSQLPDGIVIFIDGKIAGTSQIRAMPLPSAGVWVGSIDGTANQFRGAVAGLRFWNTAIDQKTLLQFALLDVFDANHPDLKNLTAMSDFANSELLLVEPPVGESAEKP